MLHHNIQLIISLACIIYSDPRTHCLVFRIVLRLAKVKLLNRPSSNISNEKKCIFRRPGTELNHLFPFFFFFFNIHSTEKYVIKLRHRNVQVGITFTWLNFAGTRSRICCRLTELATRQYGTDQCGSIWTPRIQMAFFRVNRRFRFASVLRVTVEDATLTQCNFYRALTRFRYLYILHLKR